MSTQPTEAHRELVREMALQGQYLNRSIEHYAQLLADSEARAVEDAVAKIIEANAPQITKTNAAFTSLEIELAAALSECAKLNRRQANANVDWAEQHTALQKACIAAGVSPEKVHGNSFAVPGIEELTEMLAAAFAALRAEVERLKGLASWANTCIHHNDAERARYGHVCLVCTSTRAEKAEAEAERLTKQIKDDNRAYGCELRDPNGTIWEQAAKDHARAERAEAALAEAKVERETVAEASLRSLESYIDKLKQFAERAEKAEAECLEQARLLGKSGEREADLLGKLERLNRVIERASVQFFHEGTDGETAAKMLTVLNETK